MKLLLNLTKIEEAFAGHPSHKGIANKIDQLCHIQQFEFSFKKKKRESLLNGRETVTCVAESNIAHLVEVGKKY